MLRALPPQAVGSKTVTWRPRSASSWAAVSPAIPPPRTVTRFPGALANAGALMPSTDAPPRAPATAEPFRTVRRSVVGRTGRSTSTPEFVGLLMQRDDVIRVTSRHDKMAVERSPEVRAIHCHLGWDCALRPRSRPAAASENGRAHG